MGYAHARTEIFRSIGRAIAPRRAGRVSEWAARRRKLSRKGSQIHGDWDNSRNPLLVEPMDCFSVRSSVHDVVVLFPIQFGKSEMEANILGYTMEENPQPILVVLPGEVSMNKWIDQKLNPLLDETPALQEVLTSTSSRESSNRRSFKDFQGGQLYIEHGGNPVRLKSTSAGLLLVDEFSSFASQLKTGDDPDAMVDGRTSAFPSTYKRLKVGTPEILGMCRLTALWEKSDQRRYHVKCPHCWHEQPLEWSGLQWNAKQCWYNCRSCEGVIEEHQVKTELIKAGRWIPGNPEAKIRGYHANCLYYPFGLGPRWMDLVHEFLAAQGDPAKLKTFINDRLAEAWEDKSRRNVKANIIIDRREPFRLRLAPMEVLAATAGVDTQDDRLAVQTLGWGRGMRCWALDYVELAGDPAEDEVWAKLVDLLMRPITHESGGWIHVDATAIDAGGHRTEHVKHFVRQRRIRRPMCIFGAKPLNAPLLGRPKLEDVNYKGKLDKKGVQIYQVGTIAAKNWIFQRLGADAEKSAEERHIHFSEDLDDFYFNGLVSETFNPRTGRYIPMRGVTRNEPLDTFVYAYAAAHHHDLRLHRSSANDWDARRARIIELARSDWRVVSRETEASLVPSRDAAPSDSRETSNKIDPAAEAYTPWVLDEIVCQYDREPMSRVQTPKLEAWRRAHGGTDEERALLAAALDQLDDPGTPIVAALDRALVQRMRDALKAPAITPPARRVRRGQRNSGLR